MWDLPIFIEYLQVITIIYNYQKKEGTNIFKDIIREKVKQTIIWSLEAGKDLVTNRKNSHEVYGFDLMIDSNYNVWLLEINSSPTMEYSTVKILF